MIFCPLSAGQFVGQETRESGLCDRVRRRRLSVGPQDLWQVRADQPTGLSFVRPDTSPSPREAAAPLGGPSSSLKTSPSSMKRCYLNQTLIETDKDVISDIGHFQSASVRNLQCSCIIPAMVISTCSALMEKKSLLLTLICVLLRASQSACVLSRLCVGTGPFVRARRQRSASFSGSG